MSRLVYRCAFLIHGYYIQEVTNISDKFHKNKNTKEKYTKMCSITNKKLTAN